MIHNFHRRRIIFCFFLVVTGYMVLLGRLYQIQVAQRDSWTVLIDKAHIRNLPIVTARGKIYSASGAILAESIPVHSLYADPLKITAPRDMARILGAALDMDPAALERKLTPPPPRPSPAASVQPTAGSPVLSVEGAPPSTTASGVLSLLPQVLFNKVPGVLTPPSIHRRPRVKSRFVWIKRKLDSREHDALAHLIESQKLAGFGFKKEFKRVYPNNQLMAQVLGFVGTDDEGLEGLENRYENMLGGKSGSRLVVVRPDGTVMNELARKRPEGHYDVHLTIDHVIQYYMERELDKAYAQYSPKNCFAAAMDPNTGEVLALAARPTFDPNAWRDYDRELWRNIVVSDTFEPGSTFKLVTASAALEDKKVEPTTSFFCPGKVVLWDIPIRCTSVHNDVTLEQVIERSCNSGIIKVGELLGPKNLYYYIRKFGFAEKTGVDLHSEVEGQVRPPERWSGLSVGAISMGQELSVTGMQMLSAISAIANGGLLVRPRIIKKVVDSETGAVIAEPALDVRHRVISQKTAEQVTKAMIMVTHSGSGTYAALDDYMIAGKTGTSEKLGRGKAEGNMRYVASFIGFLPAKEPKVVIYVVLNEPKGEKVRGGTMAAPVFREIARQVMLLKKVPPEVGAGTPVARISPEQEEHPLEEGPAATASAKPVPPSPNHADKAEQDEGEAPGDDPDDAGNDRDADRE